ncbi:MAG: glycosyltransferase family 39 protein [Actinomycetes bacterium]
MRERAARAKPAQTAIVVGALVFGAVLRILIYRSSLGALDGDEATWGLMARHAAHGEISTFFWGQAYGGTQEVILVAPLIWLSGTHLLLLRLVPTLLGAAAAIVVWRLGRRTIGELPGLAAGLLLWVWPPYLMWKLEIWGGFYGTGILYAALVLLLTIRLAERADRRTTALYGLVLGLAFWQSLQTLAVIVPSLLWLTAVRPQVWRQAWLGVPGALLGASPWLISNVRHHGWSFTVPTSDISYVTKLHGYATATFPMILGLRVPFRIDWIFGPAVTGLVYLGLGTLLIAIGWRTRHTPLSLCSAVLVTYPFLYATSGLSGLTTEPRYVVLALPAAALLLASLATTVARAATVVALAAALSVIGVTQWVSWSHAAAAARASVGETVPLGPALAALEAHGIDRVFANYWIANRITFMTQERVIASEGDMNALAVAGPRRVLPPVPTDYRSHHHPAYDAAVRAAPIHAYLLMSGALGTARDERLLRSHGYSEERIGALLLFVSPRQP